MLTSKFYRINENSKMNIELHDKYVREPDSLSLSEKHQIQGFNLILSNLCKENADDEVAVKYMSQFYRYYCANYQWSVLPQIVAHDFLLAYHGNDNSLIKTALNMALSGCTSGFIDAFNIAASDFHTANFEDL